MDKPVSEMSDEELVIELSMLRERRAAARERRVSESIVPKVKKVDNEVSSELSGLLDDILGDV